MDALELRRFCAFLLLMVGLLYVAGGLSDSKLVWSVASAVAVFQLVLLFGERAEIDATNLFFLSAIAIPLMTVVFLSLPKVREIVVVFTLIISNAKTLLEER